MSKNKCESANVNSITAVENPKPYGLFDAPSASTFFSLLLELEKEEDLEIGPVPKFARQSNNPALWRNDGLDYVPPHNNEPLICDVKLSSQVIYPPIPKLERQTNMPLGINLPDIDLDLFSGCQCGKMYNIYDSDECADCLSKNNPMWPYGKTYEGDECMINKVEQCECGKSYYLDESYRGMCFDCEIIEREQDLIDQILHPDDIPDIYRYDSD
jgi:hypothetical protein